MLNKPVIWFRGVLNHFTSNHFSQHVIWRMAYSQMQIDFLEEVDELIDRFNVQSQ